MAIKTQGTELYILDPDDCVTVIEVGCVTAIDGISATRDQLESTCLDSLARTYEAGMATPGAMTFTINFDPSETTHNRVYELWRAGTKFEMALGYSDGIKDSNEQMDAPTAGSDCLFDLPDTRSFLVMHDSFISNVPQTWALNALVTANVSVQLSGFPELIRRTAS